MPCGREFRIDHVNSLDELCIATPSIAQGKLLMRTASQVYCLGQVAEKPTAAPWFVTRTRQCRASLGDSGKNEWSGIPFPTAN